MSDVQIWFHDSNHAVATCGPLLIQLWRGPDMFVDWPARSTPIFEHLRQVTNGHVCVLIIVEPTAVTPSRKARIEMDKVVAERRSIVHASAVVSTGSGLRNVAVRSIISTINLLNDGNMRYFDALDAAVLWLRDAATIAGLTIDIASVRELLISLRAAPTGAPPAP